MEDLRCECRANRLLGKIITEGKRPFVSIRSLKGGKVTSEVRIYLGAAEILCVSCGRTTKVSIRKSGILTTFNAAN